MLVDNGAKHKQELGAQRPANGQSDFRKRVRWLVKQAQSEIVTEVFSVTPAHAEVLLERNKDEEFVNRPASRSSIKKFSRAMQRGWKLTGEPIILSQSGHLLNGQHRLKACIDSGVAFPVLMVFGIDDDAFAFMDQGRKRNAGDIFSICGVPNYHNAASATRWVWKYYNNGMITPAHDKAPENDEIYNYYLKCDGLQRSIQYGRQFSEYKLASPGLATALHYLCAQKSKREADDFFERVATGIGLQSKTEPAARLRDALIDNRAGQERYPDVHIGAFIVQAWNAQRRNQPIKIFRWRTKQEPNKPFPRVV